VPRGSSAGGGVAGREQSGGSAGDSGARLREANCWYEAEFGSSRRSSGRTSTSWRDSSSSRRSAPTSPSNTSPLRAASTSRAPRSASPAGAPSPISYSLPITHNNFNEGLRDIKEALRLEPHNQEALRYLEEIRREVREKDREREEDERGRKIRVNNSHEGQRK
jgi:hypothetical protein